jgi:hypothetical protein
MLRKRSLIWTAVMASGLLLGACDEAEQGRILRYEKGKYLGEPDTPLTNEQMQKLRQRATLQGAS